MHLIILVEMVMDCMIRKLKVYLLILTAMTCTSTCHYWMQLTATVQSRYCLMSPIVLRIIPSASPLG
jgi:hypothetical protein